MRLHHPKIGTLKVNFFPKDAHILKRGVGPNWRTFVWWRFRLLIVWPAPHWIGK